MKRLSRAVISLVGLALVGTVCALGEAGTPAEKPADVGREPIPLDLPKEIREQIEQLRSESEAIRVRAAQALGKMKAAAAAPFLIELLADEAIDIAPVPETRDKTISPMKWQVCREASKALLAIGPPAVEPLAKALQHRTPLVRVRAAGLLVQLSDARGRDTLLAAAKDVSFDKVARWDAMETLAKQKEPGVVEPLTAELKNPDHVWRAARLLGEAGNSRATEPLVRALAESRDWSARAMVLEALGKIGKSPQELDLVLTGLKDERKDVRLAAAHALGKMADRRAVEPLIATLQDMDGYVRLMAASALGDIGDSRAVEPLLKTFKDDPAEDTRSYAAEALGKIKNAPANEAVLTALQTALKDENLNIRCAAACALGDMKVTQAIPSLVQLLGHNAYSSREAASVALAKIGKPAVESLLAALDNDDPRTRQHAAVALGMIGDRRAVGPLINRLDDKDGFVQGKVIAALEKITGLKYGKDREKWRTWWRSAADAPPR